MTKAVLAVLAIGVLLIGVAFRMDATAETGPERMQSIPVLLLGLVASIGGIAGLAMLALLE